MKTTKTTVALLLSVLIIIISVSSGLAQSANPQKPLSVEGQWEVVSVSTQALRDNLGKRLTIARQGDGYEVKWSEKPSGEAYSGNETRIVHTSLKELCDPADAHGAGEAIPVSVRQQVAGQKVPVNVSYTLSADGRFLQRAEDARWVYWDSKVINNQLTHTYTHSEIKPGFYTATFKRIQ